MAFPLLQSCCRETARGTEGYSAIILAYHVVCANQVCTSLTLAMRDGGDGPPGEPCEQ